jgi:hypothetical protein
MLLWNLVACFLTLLLWAWGYVKNKHCRKIKCTREMFLAVGLCYLLTDGAKIFVLTFILRAFAKLRKRLLASSCQPVRMEKLGLHKANFHEILYLCIFLTSVEKIQVSIKSDKNNGYFT